MQMYSYAGNGAIRSTKRDGEIPGYWVSESNANHRGSSSVLSTKTLCRQGNANRIEKRSRVAGCIHRKGRSKKAIIRRGGVADMNTQSPVSHGKYVRITKERCCLRTEGGDSEY